MIILEFMKRQKYRVVMLQFDDFIIMYKYRSYYE